MFLAILSPLQAPGEEHSDGVRTSSQEVWQEFEGSILLWFISFMELLFHSLQIGVCLHSKEPRGQQHMAVGQPLGRCSSPSGSPLGSVGCVLGMLSRAGMHLLCLGETFCTTCCQCSDKDDFIADSSQPVIYSCTHSRGWPWCSGWRVSPPAHRLQRPPDKSRDMNKGQGSLPRATKAVLENKNSTERAHKRQKILPSCRLLSGPCLQRRGVQGQALPWAEELQQRAIGTAPGPAYLQSPAGPCPECRPFVRGHNAAEPHGDTE